MKYPKMSCAKKGLNNPMFGRHHSDKSRKKISIAMIGILRNDETRRKISLGHKGQIPWDLGKHHTKKSKQKIRVARLNRVFPNKDTDIEIKLQIALQKLNILFETHKPLLGLAQCDIFIEPNIAIFADGCWWHGCEKCFDRNKFLNSELGKDILKKQIVDKLITAKLIKEGFIVLRFWEHDIEKNFEDKVLDEIIFNLKESKKVMA